MPNAAALAALEKEIADVRENIRDLTEQAAAYSGAEDDALTADRYRRAGGPARPAAKGTRRARALNYALPATFSQRRSVGGHAAAAIAVCNASISLSVRGSQPQGHVLSA